VSVERPHEAGLRTHQAGRHPLSGNPCLAALPRHLLVVSLLLGACWRTAPRFNMRTIDGGEGLSLEVPEDFQATRNEDNLRVFSPKRERSRSPVDITITTSADKPRLPGAKTRRVGGR